MGFALLEGLCRIKAPIVSVIDTGMTSIQGYRRSRPTSVFIFLSIANSTQGIARKSSQIQKLIPKSLEDLIARD
jgi:hypothetical protein